MYKHINVVKIPKLQANMIISRDYIWFLTDGLRIFERTRGIFHIFSTFLRCLRMRVELLSCKQLFWNISVWSLFEHFFRKLNRFMFFGISLIFLDFGVPFLVSFATPKILCGKNFNDFNKTWFISQIWAEITKFSISPHLEIFWRLERDFPKNTEIGDCRNSP
jgi:hypothetical protein